jgi:ATP-binding cassette, subfamily C, bacterial CydC
MRELLPFLKLYKKHWFGLTLGILLAFLTLAASIGLLTLSGWFLSAAAVAGLTIARETFNYMLPSAFVRGFAMGRTAGRWGERVVSHNATFKVLTDLRIFFFEKLVPLIPGKISNLRDADLLNRIVADIDAMDHVYLRLISPIVVGVLGITGITLFVCWFDLHIGLILGTILLILLLLWPIVFYKLGKRNGKELTENRSNLRVALLDWLQGYSELTIFGAEPRYRTAINHHQDKLIANQLINANFAGLAQALLMIANGWTLIVILWLTADGISGAAPDSMIAMVVFATMASFEMLIPIAGAFQHLGQTLTSARRLNEIILSEPEVVFPSESTQHSGKFTIDFDQIAFSYPNSKRQALNSVSLSVAAGHKVAVVGQTGSGKSTLVQLLSRYWDVPHGQIRIAGTPLAHWNESELRACISVVSQRVDILNGSLRDNLLLAKPEANDDQLSSVLHQVGLEKLLDDTNLDTWLGDSGRQLSGGEKRRIGIARSLLHNGPILILDEPTEGLDKKTEQQIMALLKAHFTNKTVLFITHRLIDLESMDEICLMEQGEVVEFGHHHDLLNRRGRYYELHQKI